MLLDIYFPFHWPEPEHDLIVAEVSVIIDRENGLRFHGVPGKEAVVEAVFLRADDLQAWDETQLGKSFYGGHFRSSYLWLVLPRTFWVMLHTEPFVRFPIKDVTTEWQVNGIWQQMTDMTKLKFS